MASPRVLILRTAGTNCDAEMAHAFSLAGFAPETVHVNALVAEPGRLAGFAALGLPGGFSHGDDIAAGRILAARLRQDLLPALQENIQRGMLVLGVCNGFQVLVKLGLLPDPAAAVQTTTLARNRSGIFHDAWHGVVAEEESPCVWTRGLGSTNCRAPTRRAASPRPPPSSTNSKRAGRSPSATPVRAPAAATAASPASATRPAACSA